MDEEYLKRIHTAGLINDHENDVVKSAINNQLFSVQWEVRTILFLGVSLLIAGISILIYKNIDTIGHTAILAAIGLGCIISFYYANKYRVPYTNQEIKSSHP